MKKKRIEMMSFNLEDEEDVDTEEKNSKKIKFTAPYAKKNEPDDMDEKEDEDEEDEPENQITFSAPYKEKDEERITLEDVKKKVSDGVGKIRNKFRKKNEKTEEDIELEKNIDLMAESEYDAFIEKDETRKMKKSVKRERIKRKWDKIKWYLMIIAAVYIIFLVFGGIVTQFEYDKNGNYGPVKMSYSDLKNKEKFNELLQYYYTVRGLYEDALTYDYKLSLDSSQSITLSSKYNSLISRTDKVYVKVKALSTNAEYETLQGLLLSWMERFELYSKHMNSALATNDATAGTQALEDRQAVYKLFDTLTANFAGIANNVKGIKSTEIEELKSWTPDKFIYEELKKG